MMAKLDREMMDELIFKRDIKDKDVVMGPEYGEDAAIIDLGENYILAHIDPISGAVDNIGWLAINIAANDIAVSGAQPRWGLLNLQFPEKYEKKEISTVMRDIYKAADELGIEIIGGHSELLDQIRKPLITTTMMGDTKEPIFTKGSEPGDKIIQVGEAGIEGTWILASDFEKELLDLGVHRVVIDKAKGLKQEISVVEDANYVSSKYPVTSMHDPTEGGILQGLYEMAVASKNRFNLTSQPKTKDITSEICDKLNLNPLALISSGCLIFTVPNSIEVKEGKVIGEVEEGDPDLIVFEDKLKEPIQEDELFRVIKELER